MTDRTPAEGRHWGQLLRFALVGGTNTAVTLALFVLLQRWLSAPVAYTIVFALGLAYTTALTATVVFGSRLSWRSAALFAGGYLAVYGIGLLVIRLLTTFWDPSSLITATVTVVVTAPLNFLVGRLLFDDRPAATQAPAAG